mmetsp:Transcript_81315/g.158840  ORF Transcript_81315/g.158840 Transcript_81315/m.158840 type:complete len:200 (-) Transcript_81315:1070-1669(-)
MRRERARRNAKPTSLTAESSARDTPSRPVALHSIEPIIVVTRPELPPSSATDNSDCGCPGGGGSARRDDSFRGTDSLPLTALVVPSPNGAPSSTKEEGSLASSLKRPVGGSAARGANAGSRRCLSAGSELPPPTMESRSTRSSLPTSTSSSRNKSPRGATHEQTSRQSFSYKMSTKVMKRRVSLCLEESNCGTPRKNMV